MPTGRILFQDKHRADYTINIGTVTPVTNLKSSV